MDSTLQQLACDLLPVVAHCSPAAALVERVARPARPRVALLHVPDAADLQAWVAEQLPAAEVLTVALDIPATHGVLDTADLVLLAFPCGAIPTVELLTALTLPLQRPAGTYAAVFTGAEQITSADDLELVDRTALRWLLPEATERRTAGGFLWATPNAPAPLASLCDEERAVFREWLTTPRPGTVQTALAVYQLQRALDVCPTPTAAATPPPNFDQDEANAQTRQRLLTRFRGTVTEFEQQALDAVGALEASLFSSLNREESLWGSLAAPALERYATQQVQQSTSQWYESTAWSQVEHRRAQIERHLRETLADEGITTFAPAPWTFDRAVLRDLFQLTPAPTNTGTSSRSYSKVIGAALVTPLVALGVGLGPIGAVVATGVTTIAAYGYDQATHAPHPTTDTAHYLHETYATYVQAVRNSCVTTLQAWANGVRDEITTRFTNRSRPTDPSGPTLAVADLASFRQRLAAFVAAWPS